MKQFGKKVMKFIEGFEANGNEVYPYRRYTEEELKARENAWKIYTKQISIDESTRKVLLVARNPYRTCWVYNKSECVDNDDVHKNFKTQDSMIEFLTKELFANRD